MGKANELTFQNDMIRHSAGSGKSNSIAWTAHQISSLYDKQGNKQFDSSDYQMMQVLSDPARAAAFARVVFDMLKMHENTNTAKAEIGNRGII
jgi:hypothetical protein